jgi:pimeloyl-ACP methyl ester carboxylesterase
MPARRSLSCKRHIRPIGLTGIGLYINGPTISIRARARPSSPNCQAHGSASVRLGVSIGTLVNGRKLSDRGRSNCRWLKLCLVTDGQQRQFDRLALLELFRAQLKAIHRWGQQKPADLASIHQPVLVMNGESDKMVPTENTVDVDRRLPNSQLVLYPDAVRGGVFQFHEDFVKRVLEFLGELPRRHIPSRGPASACRPRRGRPVGVLPRAANGWQAPPRGERS